MAVQILTVGDNKVALFKFSRKRLKKITFS